jgi:hypothetical protein
MRTERVEFKTAGEGVSAPCDPALTPPTPAERPAVTITANPDVPASPPGVSRRVACSTECRRPTPAQAHCASMSPEAVERRAGS